MRIHSKSIVLLLTSAILSACGGGNGQTAKFSGMEFDSIVVDSIVALSHSNGSPTCHVSLSVQYAKGEKAELINDTLLRSGILTPDYLSLGNEKLTVKQAVDSFMNRFVYDYLHDYGDLYRADTKHASSYNCSYIVKTRTCNGAKNILNYIATIQTYAGGAHEIKQTIARNFDVKTGQMLQLDDLFITGADSQLEDIIVAEMADDFDVNGLEGLQEKGVFVDGQVYVSDNFIYGDDDITFIYCEDEIAPHSIGEIRVKIDIDDLKRLMR